jgi:acyl carrier protein
MTDALEGKLGELLREVIAQPLDVDPDDDLFRLGILDSLLLVRLVAAIEEEFGLEIDDRELTPDFFLSLRRMRLFVEHKLAQTIKAAQARA